MWASLFAAGMITDAAVSDISLVINERLKRLFRNLEHYKSAFLWGCSVVGRLSVLQEAEDHHLGDYDAHEHRQRIDGGIGHGRLIVVGNLVAVGQCRRVSVAAAHKTHDGQVVCLVFPTRHDSYDEQRYDGDYESVAYP